jgi:hypothetical protein
MTARSTAALLALGVVALLPACTSPAGTAAPTTTPPSEIRGDQPVGGVEKLPAPTAGSTTTAAGPAQVDVVLTYGGFVPASGAVEVGGYAAVVEQDGRCTLTLRRPGHDDVRVDNDALPDVRTTACGLLAVPADRLEPGAWQAQLTYTSERSTGESGSMTVEVP